MKSFWEDFAGVTGHVYNVLYCSLGLSHLTQGKRIGLDSITSLNFSISNKNIPYSTSGFLQRTIIKI